MEIGISLPGYVGEYPPERLRAFARRAEALGFATLWVGEHVVRPRTYEQDWPEPLATIATVAGATETIGVGTAVVLLPLRHPVLAAKSAATVQWLSGGRFSFGVGLGYARADFEAVEVPYDQRAGRFAEGLELVGRLLREDSVTFEGDHYAVDDLRLEPHLSEPPDLLVAGGGIERDGERHVPDAVKRRLLFADGWIASTNATPAMARHDREAFAAFLESNGRDIESMRTVAADRIHLVPDADSPTARAVQRDRYAVFMSDVRGVEFAEARYSMGSVEEIRASLGRYEAAGFDQVKLALATTEPDEIEEQLELWGEHLVPEFDG